MRSVVHRVRSRSPFGRRRRAHQLLSDIRTYEVEINEALEDNLLGRDEDGFEMVYGRDPPTPSRRSISPAPPGTPKKVYQSDAAETPNTASTKSSKASPLSAAPQREQAIDFEKAGKTTKRAHSRGRARERGMPTSPKEADEVHKGEKQKRFNFRQRFMSSKRKSLPVEHSDEPSKTCLPFMGRSLVHAIPEESSEYFPTRIQNTDQSKAAGVEVKQYKPSRAPTSIQLVREQSQISEISLPPALDTRVRSMGEDSIQEVRDALTQMEYEIRQKSRSGKGVPRSLVLQALKEVANSLDTTDDREAMNRGIEATEEDIEFEACGLRAKNAQGPASKGYRERLEKIQKSRRQGRDNSVGKGYESRQSQDGSQDSHSREDVERRSRRSLSRSHRGSGQEERHEASLDSCSSGSSRGRDRRHEDAGVQREEEEVVYRDGAVSEASQSQDRGVSLFRATSTWIRGRSPARQRRELTDTPSSVPAPPKVATSLAPNTATPDIQKPVAPKAPAPKAHAPKAPAPKAPAPKAPAPKAPAPKAPAPKAPAPKAPAPKAPTPKAPAKAVTPKASAPKASAPMAETATRAEPKITAPKHSESKQPPLKAVTQAPKSVTSKPSALRKTLVSVVPGILRKEKQDLNESFETSKYSGPSGSTGAMNGSLPALADDLEEENPKRKSRRSHLMDDETSFTQWFNDIEEFDMDRNFSGFFKLPTIFSQDVEDQDDDDDYSTSASGSSMSGSDSASGSGRGPEGGRVSIHAPTPARLNAKYRGGYVVSDSESSEEESSSSSSSSSSGEDSEDESVGESLELELPPAGPKRLWKKPGGWRPGASARASKSRPISPPTRRPISPPTRRPISPPTSRPISPPPSRPISPPPSRPISPTTSRPVSPPTSRPISSPTTTPSPTRIPTGQWASPSAVYSDAISLGSIDSSQFYRPSGASHGSISPHPLEGLVSVGSIDSSQFVHATTATTKSRRSRDDLDMTVARVLYETDPSRHSPRSERRRRAKSVDLRRQQRERYDSDGEI